MKISKKQVRPLIHVYTRREEAAKQQMLQALLELKEKQANVIKREKTLVTLYSQIRANEANAFSGTVEAIQQRQRVSYWLTYDLEDIEFRLNNARRALAEKQATYNTHRASFTKAQQLREFVADQSRKLQKDNIKKAERADEDAFNDTYSELTHA